MAEDVLIAQANAHPTIRFVHIAPPRVRDAPDVQEFATLTTRIVLIARPVFLAATTAEACAVTEIMSAATVATPCLE